MVRASLPAAPRRSPGIADELGRRLLRWYDATHRDLPFRRTIDPYAIWVSEVMLQQTQVQTVLPYYERWMRRFPDVRALADAEEPEVLHAFQGLGYYSRARSLLLAAREVVDNHAGELPRSAEALRTLPGIGAYTAGAIASIAFGERVPAMDGNVIRVLCRVFALAGAPTKNPLKRELGLLAESLVPKVRPGDFNQAVMELGATVCTPRAPRCASCPLESLCRARAEDRAEAFPEAAARPKAEAIQMAAAVIVRGATAAVLLLPPDAARWAGMWQFPNTELGPGESASDAALRAGRAALGRSVRLEGELSVIEHSVTRYRITLTAFRAALPTRAPLKLTERVRFQPLGELDALAMPSAHRRLAKLLVAS